MDVGRVAQKLTGHPSALAPRSKEKDECKACSGGRINEARWIGGGGGRRGRTQVTGSSWVCAGAI